VVEHVVLALDLRTQPGAVASLGVDAEAGLCLGPEVTGTVGSGRDFNVGERGRVPWSSSYSMRASGIGI